LGTGSGPRDIFSIRLIVKAEGKSLFTDLAPDPETHFQICFFGSVLKLIEGVATAVGSFEEAVERFPFLIGYNNELAARVAGLSSAEALERWCSSLEEWEQRASIHLPLRALRLAAELSHIQLLWLLAIGLSEEDTRFGNVFEALQSVTGQRQPMLAWLRLSSPLDDGADELLSRLTSLGTLRLTNPDAPRSEWVFRFPGRVWEALRHGRVHLESDDVRYFAPDAALSLDELILPPDTRAQVAAISHLLTKADACTVVVRGPRHNGRHALLGAVARALGRGRLEIKNATAAQPAEWNEAGALGMLLNAMLVTEVTLAPGEVLRLPDLKPASLPLGLVMDRQGGLAGPRADRTVVVQLDLPRVAERRQLWQRFSSDTAPADLDALAVQFRFTSGNIGRAARLAQTRATLSGRARIESADVLEATRLLDRQGLETLARHLPGNCDLSRLCASERTLQELEHLTSRCRHRETLSDALEQSPAGRLNCGVRALFSGPTGTGKTLAARLLAATLQKDLYRLDLSSVVNKFIGETEKNLNRLFDCAEELDIILLLDEGDALLTRRTDVQSANDRYANLETNFLLQRLESFQGILVITTNARDRIDSAFERRMDVVVTFGMPSVEERWQLWQSHLPASCCIDSQRLAEVAAECELTGGQIHNAVLHATLLALDNGGVMTSEYLEAAVRREYRKRGGICPLRS
jgi:ATPase family associated with various cellular activities (AAA)